jgi:hypothetical protein
VASCVNWVHSVLPTETEYSRRFPGRDWIAAHFQYRGTELHVSTLPNMRGSAHAARFRISWYASSTPSYLTRASR